ncbi:HIT domain-containing protein [Candidatus Parcubacteria bacterium]|nr:MAG: HIT domain-containing protein [Candidatus Parcubacteria bacterium]
MDCIFCKIGKGEIQSNILYQDEQVFVIKDIHPRVPVHLLIIPKVHIEDFYDVTDEVLVSAKNAVRKMVDEFKLMGKGYRVVINGGGAQIINHLHFHLMGEIGLQVKD